MPFIPNLSELHLKDIELTKIVNFLDEPPRGDYIPERMMLTPKQAMMLYEHYFPEDNPQIFSFKSYPNGCCTETVLLPISDPDNNEYYQLIMLIDGQIKNAQQIPHHRAVPQIRKFKKFNPYPIS